MGAALPTGWDVELVVDFWGTLGQLWGMGEDVGDGQVKVPLVETAQRFLSTEPRPERVTRWVSGISEEELREVAFFILLRAGQEPRS